MELKRCTRCGEEKERSAFSKDRSRKDGLQPYCKACNKAYHDAHVDTIKARKKQYYQQRSDVIKVKVREYTSENRERINAIRRLRHKERAKEKNAISRARYAQNPNVVLDRNRQIRTARIEQYRATERARYYRNMERYKVQSRNRKARKKAAEGSFTAAEWLDLKARCNYTCLRCGKLEPDIKLTPDHVVPLVHGGANTITNIQPLCLTCNLQKSTKTIDYRGNTCAI